MGRALDITRNDETVEDLRGLANATGDAGQRCRLLAIAMVREGLPRGEAARLSGVQTQTLRDWDMPKANAQTFNTHLEEISSVAGDDAITVVLLD